MDRAVRVGRRDDRLENQGQSGLAALRADVFGPGATGLQVARPRRHRKMAKHIAIAPTSAAAGVALVRAGRQAIRHRPRRAAQAAATRLASRLQGPPPANTR